MTGPVTGTAGDVDYGLHGAGYASHRRADPRIAKMVHDALGNAGTVLNVGAGAGSYEPTGRAVVAVEPSEAMVAQRPVGGAPALRAVAGTLPFPDDVFDASMATVTVHQWPDPIAGARELRRVTIGPSVVLTFDADALDRLWLMEYAPELERSDSARFPAIGALAAALGPRSQVLEVPVALDCTDGFIEAFYGRPEKFLDRAVRRSQSGWMFLPPGVEDRIVAALSSDLVSGVWDDRFGFLRTQPEFVGALRLVVSG